MAILDLQHRQRELGRIRMGEKGAKGQPVRLDTFRLTSPARHLLEEAAGLWGGEVREWSGAPVGPQWELTTRTAVLPIIIPPGREPVSSWYEQWTAAGCTHRCDGAVNVIDDSPCSCNPDERACKATTRLNVMLPDLPDIGVWRLESHGINAAIELPGTVSVILMASDAGRFLPGRLRIEARTSRKPGQPTRNFVVPVIDLDITSRELMSGERPRAVIESGTGSASPEPEPGSGQQLLPAPGVEPVGGVDPAPGSPLITEAQRKRMFAIAKKAGMDAPDLKDLIHRITGQDSSAGIQRVFYDQIIAEVEQVGSGQIIPPDEPTPYDGADGVA